MSNKLKGEILSLKTEICIDLFGISGVLTGLGRKESIHDFSIKKFSSDRKLSGETLLQELNHVVMEKNETKFKNKDD